MAELKQQLRNDMTAAMKARDKVRLRTLRMVLTAISEAEVSGNATVELTDEQVRDVLINQAKRRREAEQEFRTAGRDELADAEQEEAAVLADYLPQPLTEAELAELVAAAIAETGAKELGPRGMGPVMGKLTPQTKGRADGKAVAAEVKRQLSA
ncbi:GatB/YqeY domain-containing protein [Propionibacteriaceae bacterium Y2011]|uniref:GatB/YqeY domain-containing protein n=1 Tax=Microlunatus sp. Y2014 TaxID=3418488 RepID=UPI003B49D948